jgi:hypothetical protein
LLNGPDNTNSFVYIGIIKNGNQFLWTAKSRVGKDAPSIIGFTYVLNALVDNNMRGFEVWHEGRCGRCGKPLTVPESIASGFGPDCIQKVGGAGHMLNFAGEVAPQPKLNFDGSARQPVGTVSKVHMVVLDAVANPKPHQHALEYAAQIRNVADIDAEIKRRVQEFQSENPEAYYQDGELDAKEAYNVAYNMFRVKIEREGRS